MKVGDLVTISARGCKLRNLYMWKKYVSEHKLFGLLKEIEATAHETRYYVDWFGSDYPTRGRSGFRIRGRDGYFYRTDLKIVSKAK